MVGSGPARAAARTKCRICYTLRMFIHRISITGCSDRGAWPWRTLTATTACPRLSGF